MTRVVFLGTPEPAAPTLKALAAAAEVALVVTQPDKPSGRSRKVQPSPVRRIAEELGLPVIQPESRDALRDGIAAAGPFDAGVVVAFGRLLRAEVLEIPRVGMLNVHFSLLPRWRGAAPVNRALMAGDSMTGVTIIELDEGLDTGPVLTAQAVDIGPKEGAGELTRRLAALGARLLVSSLDGYVSGAVRPIPQTDEGATYAAKLTRDDRVLTPKQDATTFVNAVRGLSPDPGAKLMLDGEPHKIFEAEPSDSSVAPGTWESHAGWPVIGVADGSVRLVSMQPPGRNRMQGDAWARGRHARKGRAG